MASEPPIEAPDAAEAAEAAEVAPPPELVAAPPPPVTPAAPAAPMTPASRLKEWAVAVAIMIVFAIICTQFVMFLRSSQYGGMGP